MCFHSVAILNIEFEVIWRSFALGFNPGTWKVTFACCFEGSFWPQSVLVPRHNRMTYKLILCVFIVFPYQILKLRSFGDRLLWVSILVRKRLDMRHVLEVHFGRRTFGYLGIRERPINWYSVFSSCSNTKYWIWGHLEIVCSGFQSWYVKG